VNFYYPDYVRTGFTATLRRVGTSIKGRFTDTNDQVIDRYVEVRPEVIEALGKLARGGVTLDVRANAARAIGVLRGRAAIPDLIAAIKTTKETQVIYESLVAMRKIGDPAASPGIAFLLNDFDERVQVNAIETTGLLQNKEALPRLIAVLSKATDKDVRRAALTAIAMMPEETSRPVFEQHLTDKDDGVRAAGFEGLARLKNPSDLDRMDRVFREEKKMNPRLSAAFGLVMLGQRELSEFSALQYLVNSLNSTAWRGVASAFLIELTRDPEVRKSLYPGMAQRTKDEKVQLAIVLARSGAEETESVLEALSRDSEPEVATEGVRALRTLRARLRK
jgi:HEAT repeat protein